MRFLANYLVLRLIFWLAAVVPLSGKSSSSTSISRPTTDGTISKDYNRTKPSANIDKTSTKQEQVAEVGKNFCP
jgi:hypothetical protein